MENIWIQVIITVGGMVTAMLATVRYAMKQTEKRERALFKHTEDVQDKIFDYIETKNGHMERMSKDFTSSSNKMSKAVSKLTGEIKLLNQKHE